MTHLRRLAINEFRVALDAVRNDPCCSPSHVERLLSSSDPHEAEILFKVAREERERHFGRRLFVYGFVYFSTHCRNLCSFCYYRRSNVESPRYRKTPDETVKIAQVLADSGVHLIDLTLGEDPLFHEQDNFELLADLTHRVQQETGLPVMVSPGVVSRKGLSLLEAAGASWFACYQETHSQSLFRRLRVGQDYDRRYLSRMQALELGLLVEDGIMVGVGESPADRAHSVLDMKRQGVHQARAMGFVPQPGTPLAGRPRSSTLGELVAIATMRILMPDRLIPASLDVEGSLGMTDRLWAGANVVTSIIPPAAGLAGVSQSELDIEDGGRTVEGVARQIAELGLEIAPPEEYQAWVAHSRSLPNAARSSG